MKKILVFVAVLLLIGIIQWIEHSYNTEPTSENNNTSIKEESQEIQGNTQVTEHEMQQRLDQLIEMIDNHPKSAKLYAERSTIFMMMDQPVQALTDIEAAVDLEPNNAEYLTNRAMAYRRFKRIKDAINDLNKAIEMDPNLLAAYFNRGVVLFGMEKYEEAVKDFTVCIKVAPNSEQPLFNRAFSYEQLGKMEEAKADIRKFLTITENHEAKMMAENKLKEWSKIDYKTKVDKSYLNGEEKKLINPH